MKTANEVVTMLKEKDVKFVDFRFSDTRGKMQHVTADVTCVDEAVFQDGYAFDGSSIAGWKSIEASDMLLMPDPASAHIDPFFAQTTMALFCLGVGSAALTVGLARQTGRRVSRGGVRCPRRSGWWSR